MIITVDGQIGSGKSTILQYLATHLDPNQYVVLLENVGDWTSLKDSSGASIFDLFYQDKAKYSYVFQSFVLLSRMQVLVDARRSHPGKTIICERSFMTDLEIFAKSLYELDYISEIEWSVYVKWHKAAQAIIDVKVDGIIYIRATPTVCMERIQMRNRQSEDKIDAGYLNLLHKKHEEWLLDPARNQMPTLVIDGNKDKLELQTDDMLSEVQAFMTAIANGNNPSLIQHYTAQRASS